MDDTGVLSAGSVHGFISGKHYDRYKWLYPLLPPAFHILHLKLFLGEHGQLPQILVEKLQKLHEEPSSEVMAAFEILMEYVEVMQMY